MHPFSHVWAWSSGLMRGVLHKRRKFCRIGKHCHASSAIQTAPEWVRGKSCLRKAGTPRKRTSSSQGGSCVSSPALEQSTASMGCSPEREATEAMSSRRGSGFHSQTSQDAQSRSSSSWDGQAVSPNQARSACLDIDFRRTCLKCSTLSEAPLTLVRAACPCSGCAAHACLGLHW